MSEGLPGPSVSRDELKEFIMSSEPKEWSTAEKHQKHIVHREDVRIAIEFERSTEDEEKTFAPSWEPDEFTSGAGNFNEGENARHRFGYVTFNSSVVFTKSLILREKEGFAVVLPNPTAAPGDLFDVDKLSWQLGRILTRWTSEFDEYIRNTELSDPDDRLSDEPHRY